MKAVDPLFYIRVLRTLHSCTRAAHSTRLDSSMMQLTQKYHAVIHGRQDILKYSLCFCCLLFGCCFCAWASLLSGVRCTELSETWLPPTRRHCATLLYGVGLFIQNGLPPFPLWGCRASIYGAFLEVIKFVDNLLWANASDGRFT